MATGARSTGTVSATDGARTSCCGTSCRTRRHGPTCRSRVTAVGCWCTSRSVGPASTCTSSTCRPSARTVLIEGIEAVSSFTVVGDQVIGVTTLDADRGRVVSAPLVAAWHDNWCTIVPETERVIEAVVPTSESILVLSVAVGGVLSRSLRHRRHRRSRASTSPSWARSPGCPASRDREEAFFSFTSFARPPTTYRWTADGITDWSRLRQYDDEKDGPRGDYVVEQVRYPSTDGTEVPMFLVRAADDHAFTAHAVRADRLRRLQHHHGPGVQRGGRRRCATTAASTPSPTFAVVPRRARRGTAPACARTSSSPSTTSPPPPTGWSTTGSPAATASRSGVAATVAS